MRRLLSSGGLWWERWWSGEMRLSCRYGARCMRAKAEWTAVRIENKDAGVCG